MKALTARQQRFVEEYMIDGCATAAARRAGFAVGSRGSYGNRMTGFAHVAAAIEERRAARAQALNLSAERVLAEMAKIAFADPRRLVGPDGQALGLHEMDADTAATVASLVVTQRARKAGESEPERVYQYKPLDKLSALTGLGRHFGLFDGARPAAAAAPASDAPVWTPLPGPQSQAYASAADIVGFGGAAGGGKTDLACGLALTRHKVSAIFRREATQLTAVVDRLSALTGSRKGYNATQRVWRLAGRQIEFGSAPHPGDETRYQGRPKDLLVLDEAANFLESQARFLMGWVRTTDPAQKCTVLMTFNPPTSAEGRWVLSFFAPWLDAGHPNRARPGELRWFASVAGKDLEVPGGRAFVLEGDERIYDFDPAAHPADAIVRPLSRTFIPSRVADNPHLVGTGYMTTLQGLPEPLRSQMLEGDFSAGLEDDRWQVIPTAWVDAAMGRWAPDGSAPSVTPDQVRGDSSPRRGAMDSLGVDVARGGRDQTIIARRHGAWFDRLICLDGPQTPDGPSLAGQVIAARRDRAVVHIDVVGWGASPFDVLSGNDVQAVAVNGAGRATGKTREAGLRFVNLRAQIWWRMREALDPAGDMAIALPPDPQLKADLCAPRWRQAVSGIQIEGKEEIASRIGRSPDRGDAVVMALMTTPKTGAKARAPRNAGSWMG